jgi:TolB-like protein/tetratricopeptide (TPR) repeat protein
MIVLPFENLSNDEEQGYLANGISEDLTTELAQVPDLFVLSRTAAFAYKGTEKSAQQIAREMGVRYLLGGSLRRTGDDIRINAHLVDGETGGHLWAARYDGAWNDVLGLENKVVSEVATVLELRLAPRESAGVGGTTNVAAYDAFLRGLELKLRGAPHDLAQSIRHFKRAIELDPTYGNARAELAWVYYITIGNEAREQALGTGTLLKAIGLAQASFAEAMKHPSARGYQLAAERHINHWEAASAIADLANALALDPSDVRNYRQMAKAKILGGDAAEGLTFIEASRRVDPRDDQWTTVLRGLAEFALERYADSAASLESTLNGPSSNSYDNMLPLLAAYGKLGATGKATALMKELEAYAGTYGDKGMSTLLAGQHVTFVELEDVLRLKDGLIRAGTPELPFGFDPESKDRLSADEMHALMYGRTLVGDVLFTNAGPHQAEAFRAGVPWSVTVSADGSSVSYTWGEVANSDGRIHHEGDRDCFYFSYEKACAAIFRNPSGTSEERNEYYWLLPWYQIAFSVKG